MENKEIQSLRYSKDEKYLDIPESYLVDGAENYKVMNISGNRYTPYYLDGDKLLICCNLERNNPSNVYLIEKDGFYLHENRAVPVFSGVVSIQNAELIPLSPYGNGVPPVGSTDFSSEQSLDEGV